MIRFQKIPILLYHRVLDSQDPSFDDHCVSIGHFKKQMKALYQKGYQTVSLEKGIYNRDKQVNFPDKPIIITFDDGYEDNYSNVLPILRSYNFTATIFLVVDFVDSDEKLNTEPYLSWEQIRKMQDQGFEFQSHGVSHRRMDHLSAENVNYELTHSKKILEQRLNRTVLFYSYPFCQYNDKIKKSTQEAGYRGGVGGLPDISGFPQDLFEIGRSEILESDSMFMFMFKVRTGYNYYFFPLVIKTCLAKIKRLLFRIK